MNKRQDNINIWEVKIKIWKNDLKICQVKIIICLWWQKYATIVLLLFIHNYWYQFYIRAISLLSRRMKTWGFAMVETLFVHTYYTNVWHKISYIIKVVVNIIISKIRSNEFSMFLNHTISKGSVKSLKCTVSFKKSTLSFCKSAYFFK